MIKVLTASDWRQMGRLRARQHTHAGVRVERFTNSPLSTVSTLYQNAPHLAVGWIENEVLEAYICAYQADDFWVLDLMVSGRDPKLLQRCLAHCLVHYESMGITKFYYAFPKKWARAYRSFWRDAIEPLRKYTIEDRIVIEPYRIPQDKWIWQHVLHETVIPVPLLLRCSYVKTD